MKHNWKRVAALLCVFTTGISFAACGVSDPTGAGDADETKAQLYVCNYSGGVGREWLDNIIKRFQEDYATTKFTPDTEGVEVWVTDTENDLEGYWGQQIERGCKESVFFLEDVNYRNAIVKGWVLDITDIVQEDLTMYGESESIEDKLYDDQVSLYQTMDGKYYGLPHSQSPTLLTYDADYFDINGLYFDLDGQLGKTSSDADLSAGPDGQTGTYDDGMPATYAQFYELCDAIKDLGAAPIIWAGAGGMEFYSTNFAKTLRADFEGSEATIGYTFNGTATHLIESIDEDTREITYKDPVVITEENGWEYFSSAGYYYAYEFFESIYKNGYYSDSSFSTGTNHKSAQNKFLQGNLDDGWEDIAMLVEGTYWVNEAKDKFTELEGKFADASLKDRNLKVMPLPKATEAQVGEKSTYVDSINQLAFISSKTPTEKVELAKTFLQYCETQESLEEFLLTTNLTRSYDVDYSAIYDELCPYSQSLLDMFSESNYIIASSNSAVFRNGYDTFFTRYEMGTPANRHPMWAIKGGKTAVDLWNAKKSQHTAANWAERLK